VRVFLDTNVIISAFFARGLCSDLFRAVLARHDLVLTATVLDEFRRVLPSKLKVPDPLVAELLQFLEPYVEQGRSVHSPDLPLDKQDLRIVTGALAREAEVLITGDADILTIRQQVSGIDILSPRQFWDVISKSEG
jgi:putative PIN family toxin of toxin-antitoxin system